MKVCMFIWNYWPGPEGGAERQCRKQAKALQRRGVHCTVFTHRTLRRTPRRELDEGVETLRAGGLGPLTHWLFTHRKQLSGSAPDAVAVAAAVEAENGPAPRYSWRWQLFRPLRLFDYLLFMISAFCFFRRRRGQFDVIHVHGSCWMPAFALWATAGRTPVVCKETLLPCLGPFDADVPGRGLWEARRLRPSFIAIHDAVSACLRDKGVPAHRITIVPNGVDMPDGAAQPELHHRVLFIGNFSQGAHHKAFDVMLEAWAEVAVAHPEARLTMLGRGDARPWQEYAARLGCAASVDFPGSTPDLTSYYRASALFVLPSRKEGMSNALLEAQSWGLPAVVSDIPGNRAVVDDGVTGVVVATGDARRLARAMVDLLGDPARRQAMGAAARACVGQRYAMAGVAAQLEELYTRLQTSWSN